MDKYQSLDRIANSFNVISRMQGLRGMVTRSNDDTSISPSNYYIATEILKIIRDYSPSPQKEVMDKALERSNLYSSTYRNLKQHINENRRESRSEQFDFDKVIRTLSILAPVMSNTNREMTDKVIKIYEILKT